MPTSLALLVQHVTPVGGPTGPSTGGRGMLVSASLYLAVVAVGLAVAPALTGVAAGSGTRLTRNGAAGTTIAAFAVAAWTRGVGPFTAALTGGSARETAVIAAHLAAVTTWTGGALHLALSARSLTNADLRRAVIRFTPYAVTAGCAVAGTGAVLVVIDRLGTTGLLHSAFGAVVLVKIFLVALSALLGLGHRFSASGRDRKLLLVSETTALGTAVAAGSALLLTPLPAAAVTNVAAGLSTIRIGPTTTVSVFLNATRAGARLLLVSDESVGVNDGTQQLQLAPGEATPVRLVDSRATLTLTSGQDRRTVRLTPAHIAVPANPLLAGPNARDAFALGRALARTNPTRTCLPETRGLADATMRLAAHARGNYTLLGAPAADAIERLSRIAARRQTTPLYLEAPLLDANVLTVVGRLRLPAVSVVGVGDPTGPVADRYRADLSLLGDGVTPSFAGLLGYESAVAPTALRDVALYAAEPIGFLPGVLDVGHAHRGNSWVPGGSLVPTTPVRTITASCIKTEAT